MDPTGGRRHSHSIQNKPEIRNEKIPRAYNLALIQRNVTLYAHLTKDNSYTVLDQNTHVRPW